MGERESKEGRERSKKDVRLYDVCVCIGIVVSLEGNPPNCQQPPKGEKSYILLYCSSLLFVQYMFIMGWNQLSADSTEMQEC